MAQAGHDGAEAAGNYVVMWTGWVNAARNCPFCHGSGLDEDRLTGALLRILDRWILNLERFSSSGYRVRFTDGRHEARALGKPLLYALLQVYEAVRVLDGDGCALESV